MKDIESPPLVAAAAHAADRQPVPGSHDRAASLRVDQASWSVDKDGKTILHPLSFELAAGRTLGVVGPNGAGKSTLLRLLYRYQAPTTGKVSIDGTDIWQLPARVVARSIAAVLQEQPADFSLTVRQIVALGRTPYRRGFGRGWGDDEPAIEAALARMDLQHLADRQIGTLSGGERQRAMVARALAQQPRLLIFDEPTNHLDIRHQLEVLELIGDLPLTIVTSLHDLNMAAIACDEVLLLQAGRLVGLGAPSTVLSEVAVSAAFEVDARRERLAPSDTDHLTFRLQTQIGVNP
ncbi:MAG: ABC transporter ATP-binding protein [Betaproteobacteria bacterium]|nr:ABC transporter ATP-binding protein [Betaproteobacteria bacterium]